MSKILNNQAKDDLLLLYKDTEERPNIKSFFWDVLECAGCSEEFKEFLDNLPPEET